MMDPHPCIDVRLRRGTDVRSFTIARNDTYHCWFYFGGTGPGEATPLRSRELALAKRAELDEEVALLITLGWQPA